MFPPWRRRSNNGRRKGEGLKENGGGRGRAWDSSSKSRGKGEELVDGCQFPTVHEEAPRPTRPFGNTTSRKGLAVVSLICWDGTTCQRNMCVISRAKCHLAALARGAALVIDLYFFNGVPFSFEARLTGTVHRENINYSTTTPPPVLVV